METLRTLANRYRLIKHLARGGMADVFLAEDQLLGRQVAVKVLHQQFSSDRAFVERFRREAQAAANLSHPNIVSIYDWGHDSGTYFMVMELIEGRTLRDVLRTEGALLPRRAVEIALEAAAALSVAHQAGISHRDVKPGNIMLTTDGSVKVTDFGIARAFDDSEELTRTGAVIGTATYFSPEQAQGLRADPRSDIYSLGVVLYEMLTGRPPFTGESPVAVAYQHVTEYPDSPSNVPDVTAELDAIVMKALHKDPAGRYQSAEEFRSDLVRFLRNEPPAALPAVVEASEAETQFMTQAPAPTVPPEEIARHAAYVREEERPASQSMFVLGVVALVVALVVSLFLLIRLISSPAAPDQVVVPDLTGMRSEEAFDILQARDLKVRPSQQPSADVAEGLVISTSPAAGTEVDAGSFVTVVVSTGPEQFPIPLFIGLTEQEARDLAGENGLVVDRVTYEPDDEVVEGTVIAQNPGAGTAVAPGTEIDLTVSLGPDAIPLPDVSGLAERTASFQLIQAGFGADEELLLIEREYSVEVAEGFVIRTEPPAGTLVPRTGTITIFVSQGAAVVPDLTGLTVAEARDQLVDLELNLVVGPDPAPVSPDSGLDGLIAVQEPAPGTQVGPGGEITVQIGAIPLVIVPNVNRLTEAEALTALEDAGLVMVLGGTQPTNPNRVGEVVSQAPAAGTEVVEGSEVTVIIGEPRIVTVPDLDGLTQSQAQTALDGVGLTLVVGGTVPGPAEDVGRVVSQDPAAGTNIAEGSQVLVILGEETVTTTTSSTTTSTTTSSTTTTTTP